MTVHRDFVRDRDDTVNCDEYSTGVSPSTVASLFPLMLHRPRTGDDGESSQC